MAGADDTTPARAAAAAMAEAAGAWLDTLDDGQRRIATGAVPSADEGADAERRRWFYTPTDHGGLTLHEQRPAQQRAALRLVASGLSEAGYVTVATVLGLEEAPRGYQEFDAGAARKYVLNPHGLIPAAA